MQLIAIEEHFVTSDIRAAWASSAIGQEGTDAFDRGEIEERLDNLGRGRIALMDESGVDVQVLSVTTPALHNLEPDVSVIVAQRTNDLLHPAELVCDAERDVESVIPPARQPPARQSAALNAAALAPEEKALFAHGNRQRLTKSASR